jgi:hypothetical protein
MPIHPDCQTTDFRHAVPIVMLLQVRGDLLQPLDPKFFDGLSFDLVLSQKDFIFKLD